MAPEFDYYIAAKTDDLSGADILERLKQVKGSGPVRMVVGQDGIHQMMMRADHSETETAGNVIDLSKYLELERGIRTEVFEVREVDSDPSKNIWDPDAILKEHIRMFDESEGLTDTADEHAEKERKDSPLMMERLSEGQVVYTPIQKYGSTDLRSFDLTSIGLSKATFETYQDDGNAVVYHWKNPDDEPDINKVGHAMSPRFLFTPSDVADIIDLERGLELDTLMSDPDFSRNAAFQLLGVAMERMGDDLQS